MNPYAKFLGTREPREVIGETAGRLAVMIAEIGPEGTNREPAPGKWSPRQVLCHLADTEIAFGFRLRQALAEPNYVIQPFDQERWARAYSSESLDAHAALAAFRAARNWNIAFLNTVPGGDFSKPLTHPERGQMTFQTLVETMAGHDLNHLAQIQACGVRIRETGP